MSLGDVELGAFCPVRWGCCQGVSAREKIYREIYTEIYIVDRKEK